MSTPATPSELLGRDSPAILHENSSIILIECRDAEDKSNILPKNVEYGRLSNPLELQFKNHTQYRTATVDSSFTRPPFRGEGIPQGPRREWWEYWMDNEESKRSGPYDPHTSTLDRLYEAAADFRKTRYWPGAIAASWDQFRLFVGLLSNTPIWTRTDRPAPESESDDDDDEAEFEAHLANGCGPRKPPPRLRARAPYALYGVEPIPVASDDEVRVLLEAENARREEEMLAFLYDPESKFKVYLSSYMRKQGLVYYDRNLVNMPRLLTFFVQFILRNHVFPEHEMESAFKRSLDIIALAQKELILTSKIAKQLPDDFSQACRAIWGQKSDGIVFVPTLAAEDTSENEEVTKAVQQFEEDLKADNIDILRGSETVPDAGNPSEWPIGSWTDSQSNPAYGPLAIDSEWAPRIRGLFQWLGPTALPLTHTTGAVECSVRRIKSFSPPQNPLVVLLESEAEAVEAELQRHFATIVLSPWADWDQAGDEVPGSAGPQLLMTSRATIDGVKAHDPFHDEITMLVEPAILPMISVGLGIRGTWVQIVREHDFGSAVAAKTQAPTRFWYMDELRLTLPSYYI